MVGVVEEIGEASRGVGGARREGEGGRRVEVDRGGSVVALAVGLGGLVDLVVEDEVLREGEAGGISLRW